MFITGLTRNLATIPTKFIGTALIKAFKTIGLLTSKLIFNERRMRGRRNMFEAIKMDVTVELAILTTRPTSRERTILIGFFRTFFLLTNNNHRKRNVTKRR